LSLSIYQIPITITVGNYDVIGDFYESLTDEQKQKLGTLDDLIETYFEMHADTMSEDQYIEYVKNCKL
jgi:hypothetical protein